MLDLVTPNQSLARISVLLGNGDGTFRPHTDYPAGADGYRGGVVDVNGDGKLDLVIQLGLQTTTSSSYSLAMATEHFKDQAPTKTGQLPLGAAFGDFNRDGILDLVIADQAPTRFPSCWAPSWNSSLTPSTSGR